MPCPYNCDAANMHRHSLNSRMVSGGFMRNPPQFPFLTSVVGGPVGARHGVPPSRPLNQLHEQPC